ncbi:ANTAR domain-containing protein [Nocardioides aurantiacus]|nr:ANTAR domain-containing protein [Nocardioides aurantiacus]
MTDLEQRCAGLGATGLSLGLVSGGRVHTFDRGFSERTCAMFATVSLDTALPGPATMRSAQPQFFEDAAMTLARYPRAAGILAGTDLGAAACLPLIRTSEPIVMGYLALHYEGARHFDAAQKAKLWIAMTATSKAVERLLVQAGNRPADAQRGASVGGLRFELAGLREAMETGADIEQAKAMLIERFGLNADQSWNVLRRISNGNNRKVKSIARDLCGTDRRGG